MKKKQKFDAEHSYGKVTRGRMGEREGGKRRHTCGVYTAEEEIMSLPCLHLKCPDSAWFPRFVLSSGQSVYLSLPLFALGATMCESDESKEQNLL